MFQEVRTKIVATVGPACDSVAMLEKLARAGVDVFRLNCAHGERSWHDTTAAQIREISQRLNKPLAILQDLAGPKIRLLELPDGALQCALGQQLRLVKSASGQPHEFTTTYPALIDDVKIGDTLLFADGNVAMRAVSKYANAIDLEVTLAGEIRSRQGINAPGVRLQIASLTEKDIQDLDGAVARGADFISLSFVRRPEDIDQLRAELKRRGSDAHIVAKIEKPEALDCLDAIIGRTDAVMVARGDLGVEIDVARVPVVQKQIIQRCNDAGIPVITATQMLESMRSSTRPTRAEATDVANAILDGTDAVMLSAETATGLYPVDAVATMNRIAAETERSLLGTEFAAFGPALRPVEEPIADVPDITRAAVRSAGELADRVRARLVVAATHGGHTARALSKHRNLTPTLGLSDQPATVRRMCLYWGVLPVLFDEPRVPAEYLQRVAAWVKEQGLVNVGDRIVFVFGSQWAEGNYNSIVVHKVGE